MTNEEFAQEIKRLEEQMKDQINNLRIKLLESKAEKKPYEVEVPDDIDDYYYTDEYGKVDYLEGYNSSYEKNKYIRGLAFKTEEEAIQYDKERILLFKMHKWAEEHNGEWTLNWKANEPKYYVTYDYYGFSIKWSYLCNNFIKLPYLKSREIAEQFIKEFGDEIIEVLY